MAAFKEPVRTIISTFEGNPIRRTLGEHNLFDRIAGKAQAGDQWMAQARTNQCLRLVKVAPGIIFFKRSHADRDSVNFHLGPSGRTGDAQRLAVRKARRGKTGYQRDLHAQPKEEGHRRTPVDCKLLPLAVYHKAVYRTANFEWRMEVTASAAGTRRKTKREGAGIWGIAGQSCLTHTARTQIPCRTREVDNAGNSRTNLPTQQFGFLASSS